MYKCIKEFFITDDYTEDVLCIKEGSIWERDDTVNYIGGEVHLESISKGNYWIEIPESDLSEKFIEVKEES